MIIAYGGMLAGAVTIGLGVVFIALAAADAADRDQVFGAGAIAAGVLFIAGGAESIFEDDTLFGAAYIAAGITAIGAGVGYIGPNTIVTQARRAIDWATKPPQPEEKHNVQAQAGTTISNAHSPEDPDANL